MQTTALNQRVGDQPPVKGQQVHYYSLHIIHMYLAIVHVNMYVCISTHMQSHKYFFVKSLRIIMIFNLNWRVYASTEVAVDKRTIGKR